MTSTSFQKNGYNPFSAKDQYSHGYAWLKDAADPAGTDRIYVGSKWNGESYDGYSSWYCDYASGSDTENAYGDGALKLTMNYSTAGIVVKNAILQLCIDDFQAVSWESNFTVLINGKAAPFIAELLNHVDQTGPTSYIVSAIIPSGFFADIASGKLEIVIDETTGCGDGFAIDFAKLLINYNDSVFTGTFTGCTEPGATVRLLGTSTTVVASESGSFEFEAIPGLNAVRASKTGLAEGYDYGIVLSSDTEWEANVPLEIGQGTADIDFSQFGTTDAWADASTWAQNELQQANELGLIPDCLVGADLTKNITRAEFAAVSVKLYEAITGKTATASAPTDRFTDCKDAEVLKAVALGITNGTGDGSTFSPNVTLNRETAATMLTRTYKTALGIDKLSFTMPAKFADDAKISSWAYESVYFMAANGILKGGDGNKVMPQNYDNSVKVLDYANATREQALLMAFRVVDNLK